MANNHLPTDLQALRADFIPYANDEWVAGRELGVHAAGPLSLGPLVPGCYRWLRLDDGHTTQMGPETRFGSGASVIDLPRAGRYRLLWCPAAQVSPR